MAIKMAPRQRVMRKWQLFPGRNKFYCNGFLMTAPNSSIFYLTVVLITGTSGLFFVREIYLFRSKASTNRFILSGFRLPLPGRTHHLRHSDHRRHFVRFHHVLSPSDVVQRSWHHPESIAGRGSLHRKAN